MIFKRSDWWHSMASFGVKPYKPAAVATPKPAVLGQRSPGGSSIGYGQDPIVSAAISGAPIVGGQTVQQALANASGIKTAPAAGSGSSSGSSQGASSGNSAGGMLDYSTDPVLQQIQALATRNVGDAEATALAAKKQNLIRLGDPGLARATIGDQGTALAAQQNQQSTLAQLAKQYADAKIAHDKTLNNLNLFYSSTRGNTIGEDAKGYLNQQSAAQQAAQDALSQIDAVLAQARQAAAAQRLQAEQDAYARALAAAANATAPVDTGAGTGTGTGGAGGGTTTPPIDIPGLVGPAVNTRYQPPRSVAPVVDPIANALNNMIVNQATQPKAVPAASLANMSYVPVAKPAAKKPAAKKPVPTASPILSLANLFRQLG